MKNLVKEKIDSLATQLNLPYLEVIAYKGYEEIFNYSIKSEEDKNKKKLYMFSMTKPITAVAVMRLIERGKLHFDDLLIKYIPSFKDTYYIDENGNKIVCGDKITIYQLLTMTGGISYNLDSPIIDEVYKNNPQATTAEVVDAISKIPLLSMPSKKFNYSLSLDILARVIEVVENVSFYTYLKREIFSPLEMNNTSFDDSDKENFLPIFRYRLNQIRLDKLNNNLIRSKNYESGGAGLVSTVEDYIKFANCLANDGISKRGYKLLSKESVKILNQVQVEKIEVDKEFACFDGTDYGYAYGVRSRTVPTSWGLSVGEFGWDGAAGSYLLVDPKKNISIVIGMHLLIWPKIFMGKHLEIVKSIYENII